MTFSPRNLRLPAVVSTVGVALSLATAGPALVQSSHQGAPVPGHHVLTSTQPGQQTIPVVIGAPTYSITPHSSLTLSQALQQARPGAVIHLASGSYPAIYDTAARGGWVTIDGSGDATPPVIAGAQLLGDSYLRFNAVNFSSSVLVDHSTGAQTVSAKNIALLNATIDCGSNGSLHSGAAAGNTGIVVRGASQNVTLEGDRITNCTTGFESEAQDNQSSNISVLYSTIQGVSGDAIDLGGLDNVDIDHDLIGGAQHAGPESLWHNDGIQFYGNDTNVAITNNVISNSGGQLIFIQDAVQCKYTGNQINRNILVQNNLIYGAGAYAVQDQGGQNVSFIGNTIWDSHWGGLFVRPSYYTGAVPTSTTIEDNVLSGYGTLNVVPAVENDNLISGYISPRVKAMLGANDMVGATPQFADPAAGDFQLTGVTPAVPTTVNAPKTSASSSTPVAAAAPSNLGSSLVGSFGAPWYGVSAG